ncbi:hypothetical protein DP939_43290 [Spongiactinospora rosea]|uniref:Peptidase inhibitor family I36 n=1 Tax=Spongiactinospora rosea TaxID=2248750 RepID=A0A366LJ50_9ACTN|nr:peptidase inhibitor family I36 protein [Spongiactinospora rosea]RBQ13918.1 hypothetical protein DP939_43290 [Spongiactinospora rosea]
MKKALIAAVVAACAAATLTGATAAQAQTAAQAWVDCPKGYVCLYGDTNGRGRHSNQPGPKRANVGKFINDHTSSIWNRTDKFVCFFPDANFKPYQWSVVALGPGEWTNWVGKRANDKISSYTSHARTCGV